MYGIYTYNPETNPVPSGHTVAANLSIQSLALICIVPALVLLFFYVSTFRRMCAVPKIAVFRSSGTSWCPGMLLKYFLDRFEIVPVAPNIPVITVVFTLHIPSISIVRSLYYNIFSASLFHYICVSRDCYIYQHACSLFCISYYNVWLVVRDGSICLYFLIPQYGHLTPLSCFH